MAFFGSMMRGLGTVGRAGMRGLLGFDDRDIRRSRNQGKLERIQQRARDEGGANLAYDEAPNPMIQTGPSESGLTFSPEEMQMAFSGKRNPFQEQLRAEIENGTISPTVPVMDELSSNFGEADPEGSVKRLGGFGGGFGGGRGVAPARPKGAPPSGMTANRSGLDLGNFQTPMMRTTLQDTMQNLPDPGQLPDTMGFDGLPRSFHEAEGRGSAMAAETMGSIAGAYAPGMILGRLGSLFSRGKGAADAMKGAQRMIPGMTRPQITGSRVGGGVPAVRTGGGLPARQEVIEVNAQNPMGSFIGGGHTNPRLLETSQAPNFTRMGGGGATPYGRPGSAFPRPNRGNLGRPGPGQPGVEGPMGPLPQEVYESPIRMGGRNQVGLRKSASGLF
jgi:hypothetical protein